MGPNFRYWGFLSYSHDDRRVAERLHRTLETYRVPPRLVGLDGPFGPLPARLQPIFRDRDDLKAGCGLGPEVERALSTSRSLIVLCSPAAAASPWVDAEVAAFGRMHPEAPLFCVFLAGDPLASGDIQTDTAACLPPAARARFIGEAGIAETAPIAVDLRPDGDGWRMATHKIVAGLAGLPLDQLVQRDAQRRHRRMAWLTAVLAAVAIALGTLSVVAYQARDAARLQRAQAEGLIEFMLVDLRKRLEPAGRLDALDAVGSRALRYYEQQTPHALDADALGRRARALHLIGEVSDRRGDMKAARKAFASASVATGELLARAPEHPQRLYDHAQSVFWNGSIDWQYGDVAKAEAAFREYARLARKLSSLDADNADWLTELGYAHSNLGVLLLEQGRAEQAIPQFRHSLRINRKRATLPGDAEVVQLDIAQDRSWLSSAYFANRSLREAMVEREAELAIYRRLIAKSPDSAQIKERQLSALQFLGELHMAVGSFARAAQEIGQALVLAEELHKLDSDNVAWQQSMVKSRVLAARLARRNGDLGAARGHLAAAGALVATQLSRDAEAWVWKVELQESVAIEQAALQLQDGQPHRAEALVRSSHQRLTESASGSPATMAVLRLRILNAAMQAQVSTQLGDRDAQRRAWKVVAALAKDRVGQLDGACAASLVEAWRGLGQEGDARRLSTQLLAAGYRIETAHQAAPLRGKADPVRHPEG